jgi:hypothetical protein
VDRQNATLIDEAVDTVLETMFFSATDGPGEPDCGGDVLEASLAFAGRPSGTLDVRLSAASACLLAAAFLGEDEASLTPTQPGEVLCELANMLCGALLSRLDGDEVFHLGSPRLVAPAETTPAGGTARSFALEGGTLTVTWQLAS